MREDMASKKVRVENVRSMNLATDKNGEEEEKKKETANKQQ